MSTTKSPRRVLQYGYLIGLLTLRPYSSKYSRKTFSQPQLFACLVLKEFLQFDYRKVSALLRDTPNLAAVIELETVPHFTTLQKAAARLLTFRPARRLLDQTIHVARKQRRLPRNVSLAAIDGTGLETRHASSYYVRRRANNGKYWHLTTFRRFPKAGLLCDCRSHLILAVVPGRGPGPDILHFRTALDQALSRVRIGTLAADAGYDAEHSHQFARQERGVRSLIPAKIGRQTTKPASGYWRRQMQTRLHLTRYPQRWQIETVNSMIKRLLGSALRARSYWSQCREILLRTITHNVMILRRTQDFYRAGLSPSPRRFSDRLLGQNQFHNSLEVRVGSCAAARSLQRCAPTRPDTVRHESLVFEFLSPQDDPMQRGFLIDMDGVIYRGGELIPGAVEFIGQLQDSDTPFVFMTNNSQRTRRDVATRLSRMGIDVDEQHVFTCAIATARFLAQQLPGGTAYVIGEGGLLQALHTNGYSIVDHDPDYVVVGEGRAFSFEMLEVATRMILSGAKLIATNLDPNCPTQHGMRPGCGAIVAMLETATGLKAFSVGKPSPVMLRAARKELSLATAETTIIGDTMETDILGGVQMGYRTVLVLSGGTRREDLARYAYRPDIVVDSIADLCGMDPAVIGEPSAMGEINS